MKENSGSKSLILFPLQLAEDANRGFVKVIQHLFRLVNYDFHTLQSKSPNAYTRDVTTSSFGRTHFGSPQPEVSTRSSFNAAPSFSNDNTDSSFSQDDDPVEIVSLLFSDNAEQRLFAIRWVSDHQYRNALPMLESILLIEDDHCVYDEICKLIALLRETDAFDADRI